MDKLRSKLACLSKQMKEANNNKDASKTCYGIDYGRKKFYVTGPWNLLVNVSCQIEL
jgi:hypothetical protein